MRACLVRRIRQGRRCSQQADAHSGNDLPARHCAATSCMTQPDWAYPESLSAFESSAASRMHAVLFR